MADNDVRIKLSLDGADTVQKGLSGVGDSATQTDSKLGGMVKGGLAGAGKALVGFGVAAVGAGVALASGVASAYADAEQSVGGIETLFGDSADKMKNYAKDAYKDAGLSANEYMEQATSMSASLIQSVGGDTAKAAELANTALVAMSDNANKMGSDLSSIQDAFGGFAKGNFTMLDNLKLGYGGTQAEMQRLLSDAEKLPGAMGQKFDLSNYGDIVQAIQLVQEEMGIAGTTALEANATISGSVGTLKGSFGNLLVAMGSANNESLAFLDVQEQAANVVSSLEAVIGNVGPVLESLGSSMATLGPQMGDILSSLVTTIASALPSLITAGTGLIGGLIQGVVSALPGLVSAAVPAIASLVEMIATQLPLLIDAGMQAVVALGQGIVEAMPTLIPVAFEMVTGLINSVVENLPMVLDVALQIVTALGTGLIDNLPTLIAQLPTIIQGLVDFFTGAIPMIIETGMTLLLSLVDALPEIIAGLVAAIPQIITGILDAVLGSIPQLIDGGIQLFMGLIGALPSIIVGVVGAIPQIVTGLVSALASSIPRIVTAGYELIISMIRNIGSAATHVAGAIPGVITGIVSAVKNGIGSMISAGGDLVRGLWTGINNAKDWILGKISGWVDDIVGGIKSFFGIGSPSKRMRDEVGQWLPAGVGKGVDEGTGVAMQSVENMSKSIAKEAKKMLHLGLSLDDPLSLFDGPTNRGAVPVPTWRPAVVSTRRAVPTPHAYSGQSVGGMSSMSLNLGDVRLEGTLDIAGDGVGKLVDARLISVGGQLMMEGRAV